MSREKEEVYNEATKQMYIEQPMGDRFGIIYRAMDLWAEIKMKEYAVSKCHIYPL